jgi:arylsulfatase
LPEDAHPDVFVGERACWWVRNPPKAEPLFLQVGFPGPHPPYDPTPAALDAHRTRALPVHEVTEADQAGQPEPFEALRRHDCHVRKWTLYEQATRVPMIV